MIKIIAVIILLISFFGIIVIISKKISDLIKLSKFMNIKAKRNFLFNSYKYLIKKNRFITLSSIESFLEKILSRIRILILKVDNKAFGWLKRLREKSQDRKKRNNLD